MNAQYVTGGNMAFAGIQLGDGRSAGFVRVEEDAEPLRVQALRAAKTRRSECQSGG